MTNGGWCLALGTVALLATACASAGESGTAVEPARVIVENDIRPQTSVTVWIAEQGGTRSLLGGVGPDTTGELEFDPDLVSGLYRLVARTSEGQEIVSDSFRLGGGDAVTWRLTGNVLGQ